MKRKPLSFEEKRQRLLKIFHERQEVLNLKELEKYGPKEGIVLQTVKDVLDSLLADNLVLTDKIGAANFFWSLPSQAAQTMRSAVQNYEQEIEKLEEEKIKIQQRIEAAQNGKEETSERKNKLNLLKQLKDQYESKLKEISVYRKNDAENLTKLEKEREDLKKKANEWTDNLYSVENFMIYQKKFSKEDVNNLKKMLEIPEELDYVE